MTTIHRIPFLAVLAIVSAITAVAQEPSLPPTTPPLEAFATLDITDPTAAGSRAVWSIFPQASFIGGTAPVYGWRTAATCDPMIGLSVTPVDAALASQLGLAKGLGLVVTAVVAKSPAAKAGIAVHDVLLRAGDRALSTGEDLKQAVAQADGKVLTIRSMRRGKPLEVAVTPEAQAALPNYAFAYTDFAAPNAGRYKIGVAVEPADPALRDQIGLDEGCGLVVTAVEADGPAAGAGLVVHDILTTAGGATLDGLSTLREALKKADGAAIEIGYVRAGRRATVKLKAVKQAQTWTGSPTYYGATTNFAWSLQAPKMMRSYDFAAPAVVWDSRGVLRSGSVGSAVASTYPAGTIDAILAQIDELRRKVETLRGAKEESVADPDRDK